MRAKRFHISQSIGRTSRFFMMLLVLFLTMPNCHTQDPEKNQGVKGTILFWEGNFQCCPITGTQTPVRREVHVFELTNDQQVTKDPYSCFYISIQSKFITKASSDDSGWYVVGLDPGKYSLFIKEGTKFYANRWDGYGNIQPVEVVADKFIQKDIDITYKAIF